MKKNAATHLRDAIENDILTGTVCPGERLDEVSLANRFGVSRTPVREALAQLDSVGLIELRPNRGAIVAQVGTEQLVQMFEVMAELEGMALASPAGGFQPSIVRRSALLKKSAGARQSGATPTLTTMRTNASTKPSIRRAGMDF